MKSRIIMALSAAVLLMGCDVSTPSSLTTQHIQVKEVYKTEVLDLGKLDEAALTKLAGDYSKNGSGTVQVIATYLGEAKDAQKASAALGKGQRVRSVLNRKGVTDIAVNAVSVKDAAKSGRAFVTYRALTATPPEGCTNIPGHDGADNLDSSKDYGMGCGVKTIMSQMVADPEDLLGNDDLDAGAARRQGTVVETYKSGTPNTLFGGVMTASEVGGE